MTSIYFADKGNTRKHGCPNLWPVKNRVFELVPRDVFSKTPIVVYVDPKSFKNADGGVRTQANFAVFESARVQYAPHWNGEDERMFGGCVMHATYAFKTLCIHSNIDVEKGSPMHDVWNTRETALNSLREAFELYLRYFPEA